MATKHLELLESASNDVAELSSTLKKHKDIIGEFDSIAKSIINEMEEAQQESQKATSILVESSNSINGFKAEISTSLNNLKVSVAHLSDSNLKIIENVHGLSKNISDIKAGMLKSAEINTTSVEALVAEVKNLREAVESKTFFNSFRRKN